jgi:kumamolisin
MPNEVADAYDFPKDSMGAGQSVAIIELGGGLNLADNAKYYTEHGLKVPNIQLISVDGAKSNPDGNPRGPDREVALDSQVIGAVAPDAKQQIIFGTNDSQEQGFVDAITRAIFPKEGEQQNSAISISWGRRESKWDPQVIKTMHMNFKKAALKGITVFAAAGDTGASDRGDREPDDGKFVTDYPASDPWVTSTGGTKLSFDESGKAHDVVWNDGDGTWAGGGGVSQIFSRPDFQNGLDLPTNPHPANADGFKDGRGVPDIAGNAASATPYWIRADGQTFTIGGTSAVAPLYAALMMRINGSLGRPVGYLNPFLYKHGNDGIFNDITEGNNNGFEAKAGWDATTGWGSIRGTAFLNQLRKDLGINA